MELAQEKGGSNWLTALPLNKHGFTLHKGAFQDAIALYYQPTAQPMCLWFLFFCGARSLMLKGRLSPYQA